MVGIADEFTDWEPVEDVTDDAADEVAFERILDVVWGGDGDDESQVLAEYRIELRGRPTAECGTEWTISVVEPFG